MEDEQKTIYTILVYNNILYNDVMEVPSHDQLSWRQDMTLLTSGGGGEGTKD